MAHQCSWSAALTGCAGVVPGIGLPTNHIMTLAQIQTWCDTSAPCGAAWISLATQGCDGTNATEYSTLCAQVSNPCYQRNYTIGVECNGLVPGIGLPENAPWTTAATQAVCQPSTPCGSAFAAAINIGCFSSQLTEQLQFSCSVGLFPSPLPSPLPSTPSASDASSAPSPLPSPSPDPVPEQPVAGSTCPGSCVENGVAFCDFAQPTSGHCVPCSDCSSISLSAAGRLDCDRRCPTRLTVSVLAAGDVSDYTEAVKRDMRAKIASQMDSQLGVGMTADDVAITVESASVRITIAITAPSKADADGALSTFSSLTGTPAQASALLTTPAHSVNVLSILTLPAVEVATHGLQSPSPSPPLLPPADGKCVPFVQSSPIPTALALVTDEGCPIENAFTGSCGAFEQKSDCWKNGECCAKQTGDCCEANSGAVAGVIIGAVVVVLAILCAVMASVLFCACCSCCACNRHHPARKDPPAVAYATTVSATSTPPLVVATTVSATSTPPLVVATTVSATSTPPLVVATPDEKV